MSRRSQGLVALGLLGLAAAVLIGIELAKGALTTGSRRSPTRASSGRRSRARGSRRRSSASSSTGSTGQPASNTTREELVLSIDPELGRDVEWDRETLERAVRSGLFEAINDAQARGGIGRLEARIMREVVQRAPLDWLIQGGSTWPTSSAASSTGAE